MKTKETILLLLVCLLFPDPIQGHGYMIDPLSRSATMHPKYRSDEHTCDNGQTNWTPQGNFCGGRETQEANGGNCSACGDNYASAYPRPHDYGGMYATDIEPTRIYLEGQLITVIVRITASHLGHFTFKLCNKLETDYPNQDILTACFNDPSQHTVLEDENGNTHFGGVNRTGNFTYSLVLPGGVTCPDGCSLQWWYETANSPGLFPEHFVNCADIRIVDCSQYTDSGLTWCGLGPTTELIEWCQGTDEGSASEDDGESNSSEDGSSEGSSDEDSSNEGSSGEDGSNEGSSDEDGSNEGSSSEGGSNEGGSSGDNSESEDQSGDTEDENNGEGESGNQDGDENNGEEQESEASSQTSGNCIGQSSDEDGSGSPSCASCTKAQSPTCNNNCCSQNVRHVYVSAITDAPDMWCEVHCTNNPPFCPSKWCCKKEAVYWMNVCSTKKSLTSLVDLLERKVQEIKRKSAKSKTN